MRPCRRRDRPPSETLLTLQRNYVVTPENARACPGNYLAIGDNIIVDKNVDTFG
jgi:hypothetical protein